MLPPALVQLLNSLYHNESVTSEALEAAHQEVDQWSVWYSAEEGFWVDSQERGELQQIQQQMQLLPGLLDAAGPWQPLLQAARGVNSLIESVNQRRAQQPYAPLPAFHHLILACGAVIIGQGRWEIVPGRCDMVQGYVENLQTVFASLRGQLEEPAQQAVNTAFRLADEGLASARQAAAARNPEGLREALQLLQQVAEMLEVLPRVHRLEHEQLQQQFQRFNIPLIGYRLEHDLQATGEIHRRFWSRAATTRLQETIPVLERFWQEQRGTFLLPQDREEDLLVRIDQALSELVLAYQQVLRREPSDQELRHGLESAMVELAEAFDELETTSLNPDSISSPLARYVAECARNIRGGLMADAELLTLVEHLQHLPAWETIRGCFVEYLQSGSYAALSRAAWLAVDASQSLATGADNLDFMG